ncbi:MAG: heavy metal translocating P-type ATPase [Bacteroidetes bacterium 24-39-8]|jgi:Cu+-exporting ATPase|nr:MAG: heavy metal translocating P-type ATPase [Sphingobacteriia bacterium 35-40-8]OYZ49948.1 MAG: heavy metal translocating P-type ATPase [Bacteroidetes bacterium 24-39-8]HQS55926.1 heavy metal translocating P-type ATPase metal-binding domain-containing protein [Sediminibacterium sp.]
MPHPTVKHEPVVNCYHCGEDCKDQPIMAQDKAFCCDGCKMVYEILNQTGMCDYYELSNNPGTSQKIRVREDKFAFLDDAKIQASLLSFTNDKETHINFYMPQMHCSSCLWLLENLHRLNPAVIASKVNFERKEADIVFDHRKVSMRQLAELLASIGYEPYISFNDLKKQQPGLNMQKVYKLGVAGFCFANIMLFSFPEYLGIDAQEAYLMSMFRYMNILLSLPVFFYCTSEFYISAWKSLKHGFLNIDAPIVLAVVVAFARSLYEVFTGTGSGYFDSMSGIVFFMLIGRVLQDKTYQSLSFERDYTAYFPIAVSRIKDGLEASVALPDIALNDTLLIHNQELIPADGILTMGKALIDYSFVTGESLPVEKEMGEIVYAGGKQIGGNIELLVIKEVAQSYLTKLWNRSELQQNRNDNERSFVHLLSRYFTWILFTIALVAGIYWWINDVSKVGQVITAVLIVACPCSLLLSNTFTNGNVLRKLGRNHFYLRNAETIEDIAKVDHIVFDKTGTLTTGRYQDIQFEGKSLDTETKQKIAALSSQSLHPMSKAITQWAATGHGSQYKVSGFEEIPGKGVQAKVGDSLLQLGSALFVTNEPAGSNLQSAVYLAIDGEQVGRFSFRNHYRDQVPALLKRLGKMGYPITILSGDNAGEKAYLQSLLGANATILFHQKPEDKLEAIKKIQAEGHTVMMVGDGLNDAGALRQANVGLAISENSAQFTPASDVIMDADMLPNLYKYLLMCKWNKILVMVAFIVSLIYNVIGEGFAVQGQLSPMVAAILMPISSLSILIIAFGASNFVAWKMGLGR